ncbi:hypothetical protein H9Y04_40720 [Streptomyces sp. TRM66268-LWL]|uniref:Uncharacterized protein n=1 Tax=Streptomyces polyasparticus TaxID=2767826 RepID=A0ABR7SWI5_9ACTN|nr:hypothetical protein [Streptomyces polyasparticus]MBC9718871.1 hypothetical protein [Streptomyces polyasparticus]
MATPKSSRTLIAVLIAILAGAEVALITSDVDNTIRYGVGAAILIALIASVAQLSRARSTR